MYNVILDNIDGNTKFICSHSLSVQKFSSFTFTLMLSFHLLYLTLQIYSISHCITMLSCQVTISCFHMPKFHYADFPVTSATTLRQTRDISVDLSMTSPTSLCLVVDVANSLFLVS